MSYIYDLDNGQRVVIENNGGETLIAVSSGDEGQQQSQSTGFQTGPWTKTPTLFRAEQALVLRLEGKNGTEFIRVRGSQIQRMRSEPDLAKAEKLKLKKSDESIAMKPMEPMKPMKPMESMKPMEPMRPMKPLKMMRAMRPMEMRMGDMHMKMGGHEEESAKRFCTQCGGIARSGDRFCGKCGHELPAQN